VTTLPLHNTVEVTVKQAVDALVCLADSDRTDVPAISLRQGFIDGISDEVSRAEAGIDPRSYAAGYAFGCEIVELLRWTHEIQADTTSNG
jgi:hypothetical protein